MLKIYALRLYEGLFLAATIGLAVGALAPYLGAGHIRAGMLFTYPPRIFVSIAAAMLLLRQLRRGQRRLAAVSALAAVLAFSQIGWGGRTLSARVATAASGTRASSAKLTREYTLLAFNIHNAVGRLDEFSQFLEKERVDFMSLQEVPEHSRKRFVDALTNYAIFHGDESLEFEHDDWGPFASITGIRRELLAENDAVAVDTAITQYRTFATEFRVHDTDLWIVNVHTTKAFWLHDDLSGIFSRAGYKSAWHFGERDDLANWIDAHPGDAVIAAGDFNAPHYSTNVALDGLHNAHLDIGRGPHLSIPARFPIWGLDHTLGTERIVFTEYRLIDTGLSDHRAQLVRFRIVAPGTT